MNNPLVSIILPVYKVENYLNKCLDCLINQTYNNIQIILVDDGSPDNCPKICDEYASKDKRIVVIHQKNQGAPCARNSGLKEAEGEYIMFCDSDDYYEHDMVDNMVKTIIEQNVDAVRCKAKVYDKDGNYIVESFRGFEDKKLTKDEIIKNIDLYYRIKDTIHCWVWALILKRERAISFKADIKVIDDFEWYSRFLLNIDSIYYLDKPLYNYIFNPNSLVNGFNADNIVRKMTGYYLTFQTVKENLKEVPNYESLEKELNLKNLYYVSDGICIINKTSYKQLYDVVIKVFDNDYVREICGNLLGNMGFVTKIRVFFIRHRLFRLLTLYFKLK